MAADEEHVAEAAQQASQRLQALESCLEPFFGALLPEVALACKEAVFTGAALFVAGAFATEEALWLALCLQVQILQHIVQDIIMSRVSTSLLNLEAPNRVGQVTVH